MNKTNKVITKGNKIIIPERVEKVEKDAEELFKKLEDKESKETKDISTEEKVKEELAEFKERVLAQTKEFAEKKVVDNLDEYKKEIIQQFLAYSKRNKGSLPVWQRDLWDILRKFTYALSSAGVLFTINEFISAGDFTIEAFRNLGITVAILLTGFVQEHFKNLRKVKEEKSLK